MAIAKPMLGFVLVLLLGGLLRFWNLELKPLWMDEVITALFSLGRTYYDVPLDQALPVSRFEQIFRLNPSATCAQIATTIATQSVHPPLFFCWLHQWLTSLAGLPMSWIWKLRAFPALIGVVAIAAVYQLNCLAFSARAGLLGAAVMAVSPFAVYLSQEARHYTLPMLLVILALSGLYQLLTDLRDRQFRPLIWLGWSLVNSLGFYVHYFFLLAFAAQALILLGFSLGRSRQGARPEADSPDQPPLSQSPRWSYFRIFKPQPRFSISAVPQGTWLSLGAIALVTLSYVPWAPTLIGHLTRPETDWVKIKATGLLALLAPLLQIISGWALSAIVLPVEHQPRGVAIFSGFWMVVFAVWLAGRVGWGLWSLWRHPETRLGVQMLGAFYGIVVLEFLAIAYGSGKDFTQVPRYNFIYFPAICALIGAGLAVQPSSVSPPAQPSQRSQGQNLLRRCGHWCHRRAVPLVLCVATCSSLLVISNHVFQKPYQPDQVAKNILQDTQPSVLAAMAYNDFQDLALGMSFALQLAAQSSAQPRSTVPHFAFMVEMDGYGAVWTNLMQLAHPLPFPLNLWVIAPGLKRGAYRPTLQLSSGQGRSQLCAIAPEQYYRIGIPYQLYRCP